jgi:tetratricopeptide (TPR) repeat protein
MICRPSSFIRNLLPCNLLLCLISLLVASATTTLVQAEPTALQNGSSVTREINPAESHVFELTLEAQQLISLSVFAGDLNFAAHMIAPDGHTVEELVHRRYGPLTWQFIAPEQGSYRLVISSLELKAQPRKYQLKVEQIRASVQHERQAAQAASAFRQAEVLRFKWHSNDLVQAAERYRAAADIWQQQEQWAEAAEASQRLGELHFIQGDYRRALNALTEALNASQRSHDLFLTLIQLNNIAYVHIYLGELKEAAGLCEQVQTRLGQISAGTASQRQRIEAQLQNNFGEIEYARGNLKVSLNFFARARALWEEVGDRQGIALARLNAGYSDVDSGHVNEAGIESKPCNCGER